MGVWSSTLHTDPMRVGADGENRSRWGGFRFYCGAHVCTAKHIESHLGGDSVPFNNVSQKRLTRGEAKTSLGRYAKG
jgi:hypothetical protein